jgi:hypothetical protein
MRDTPGGTGTARISLSRDLAEFLLELSIGLHLHAMYPDEHPALRPAAAHVLRRAERILEDRQTFAVGIARNQLVIEGVATDPNQPVLRRLAQALHRHHLGAISVCRGVQIDEVSAALRSLSTEGEGAGPRGLALSGRSAEHPHIQLHPLTFDRLELVDDAGVPEPGGGARTGRAAELWIGLARAAMAGESVRSPGDTAAEPALVARAIDAHHGTTAYDQVIVGYLLQIASELKTATDVDAVELRRRTARLVRALRPETLRGLVTMGGDAAQRRAFVLDAASGMAVDAVVDIVKAAAEASGETISHGLVRMLSKLAAHAEAGREAARPLADQALREQVGRLLDGWELPDPNPDAYGRVLQHLATRAPEGVTGATAAPDTQTSMRVVQMALEADGLGPLVDRAVARLIGEGATCTLLDQLDSAPQVSAGTAAAIRRTLLSPASMAALVSREPLDVDSLDRLLPQLTLDGYEVLLDALVASPNRSTRRRLLDRLVRTGLDVGPRIAARLGDERWYVQRNMLVLLQHLPRLPDGFSPAAWTGHDDPRVRYEAIQLQLAVPSEREHALGAALADGDPRILRLGLTAIQGGCPSAAARRVVEVAISASTSDEIRVMAARTLGRLRHPEALDGLLQLVEGGRTLLRRPRLAARSPVSLAAIRALADGWSADPRAAVVLSLARASGDHAFRDAASPPAS